MFQADKPFNELPILSWDLEIWEDLIVLARDAEKAIEEYIQVIQDAPGFIDLSDYFILQEALFSSKIENIHIDFEEFLFLREGSYVYGYDNQKVLANYNALIFGRDQYRRKGGIWFTVLTFIQGILEPDKQGVRKIPGTVIANHKGEVIYTPPVSEIQIIGLLSNLENFIHERESNIHTLIKLALIHYQFESIHPFYDGNGRTGRVLMDLYMDMLGILPLPVLRLSQYIYTHQWEYYKLLLHTTKSSKYDSFIKFILSGVISQCKANILYVQKIRTYKNKLTKTYEKGSIEVVILQILFQKIFILEKNLIQTILKMWEDESEIISKIESFQDLWVLSQKIQWNEKYLYIPGFLELISRAE